MAKKSYMDTDIILKEGLMDLIVKALATKKSKQVKKAMRKNPEIAKKMDQAEKMLNSLERDFEKRYGRSAYDDPNLPPEVRKWLKELKEK